MMTRNECAQWLLSHDRYVILTHGRPDGDTVGASAALCLGLRKAGKEASVLRNPEISDKYAELHRGLTKDAPEEGDVLVCVDVAAKHMLPKSAQHLADRITLRIDHHYSSDSFTPLALVDAGAAAAGEIVYDILCEMGVSPDARMGAALYTAISTDTGCFRFANTTAHTHLVAAACAQAGTDLYPINQALFDTNSIPKLRMQCWIAENTDFFEGGKLAVCAIPAAVEKELGIREDEMENLSGFTRSIAGVRMAATLRENGEGVKMSVRSVPGYDASEVCKRFGGGGHKEASGASCALPLSEAAAKVKAVMLELEGGR